MATNDQDYRTGMQQGQRDTAYDLTDHRLAGLSCRDWETCCCTPCLARKEIMRLRRGIRHALDMYPTFPIDYNVRLRLEKLLQSGPQEEVGQ